MFNCWTFLCVLRLKEKKLPTQTTTSNSRVFRLFHKAHKVGDNEFEIYLDQKAFLFLFASSVGRAPRRWTHLLLKEAIKEFTKRIICRPLEFSLFFSLIPPAATGGVMKLSLAKVAPAPIKVAAGALSSRLCTNCSRKAAASRQRRIIKSLSTWPPGLHLFLGRSQPWRIKSLSISRDLWDGERCFFARLLISPPLYQANFTWYAAPFKDLRCFLCLSGENSFAILDGQNEDISICLSQ